MDQEQATRSVSQRNAYIYTLLWSFVSGVLVSSFVSVTPMFSVFLVFISLAVFVIERLRGAQMHIETVLMVLAVISFAIGALRYDIKDFHEPVTPSGEGMVASEPEHRDSDTRFVYEADNGERALVSTDMYSHVEYGDRVSVGCAFKQPEPIVEDNGRVFDYPKFLSKDDIYYTCSFAKVMASAEQLSPDSRSASGHSRSTSVLLQRQILRIKNVFIQKMKAILPEPESSLLAGLIVAGKQALSKSVLADFQNAGVSHIVVLSGYNITVVAEFFLVLLGLLSISLRRRAVFAALGILVFVLMAGASASIVRAALMALVVLLGRVIHRGYSAPRMLLLTAALMIMWNPKMLVFDPSFQLTFLAMLALIYIEPLVSERLAKMAWPTRGEALGQSRPLPSWLATLLATTLATQLTVLPYLLYTSGGVSAVSLFSNLLILVFVPVTMLIGFIATLIAFISTYLAWPFAFVSHILLAWILGVAHTLGTLSWASIQISHMSLWLTLVCYAALLTLVMRVRSSLPPPSS